MHSSTLSLTLSFDIVFWNCIHHSITLYMMKVTLVKVLFLKKKIFTLKSEGERVCVKLKIKERMRDIGAKRMRERLRGLPLLDFLPWWIQYLQLSQSRASNFLWVFQVTVCSQALGQSSIAIQGTLGWNLNRLARQKLNGCPCRTSAKRWQFILNATLKAPNIQGFSCSLQAM